LEKTIDSVAGQGIMTAAPHYSGESLDPNRRRPGLLRRLLTMHLGGRIQQGDAAIISSILRAHKLLLNSFYNSPGVANRLSRGLASLRIPGRQTARRARFFRPLLGEQLERRALLAAVSWDGGGNDFNWSNPLNWS